MDSVDELLKKHKHSFSEIAQSNEISTEELKTLYQMQFEKVAFLKKAKSFWNNCLVSQKQMRASDKAAKFQSGEFHNRGFDKFGKDKEFLKNANQQIHNKTYHKAPLQINVGKNINRPPALLNKTKTYDVKTPSLSDSHLIVPKFINELEQIRIPVCDDKIDFSMKYLTNPLISALTQTLVNEIYFNRAIFENFNTNYMKDCLKFGDKPLVCDSCKSYISAHWHEHNKEEKYFYLCDKCHSAYDVSKIGSIPIFKPNQLKYKDFNSNKCISGNTFEVEAGGAVSRSQELEKKYSSVDKVEVVGPESTNVASNKTFQPYTKKDENTLETKETFNKRDSTEFLSSELNCKIPKLYLSRVGACINSEQSKSENNNGYNLNDYHSPTKNTLHEQINNKNTYNENLSMYDKYISSNKFITEKTDINSKPNVPDYSLKEGENSRAAAIDFNTSMKTKCNASSDHVLDNLIKSGESRQILRLQRDATNLEENTNAIIEHNNSWKFNDNATKYGDSKKNNGFSCSSKDISDFPRNHFTYKDSFLHNYDDGEKCSPLKKLNEYPKLIDRTIPSQRGLDTSSKMKAGSNGNLHTEVSANAHTKKNFNYHIEDDSPGKFNFTNTESSTNEDVKFVGGNEKAKTFKLKSSNVSFSNSNLNQTLCKPNSVKSSTNAHDRPSNGYPTSSFYNPSYAYSDLNRLTSGTKVVRPAALGSNYPSLALSCGVVPNPKNTAVFSPFLQNNNHAQYIPYLGQSKHGFGFIGEDAHNKPSPKCDGHDFYSGSNHYGRRYQDDMQKLVAYKGSSLHSNTKKFRSFSESFNDSPSQANNFTLTPFSLSNTTPPQLPPNRNEHFINKY